MVRALSVLLALFAACGVRAQDVGNGAVLVAPPALQDPSFRRGVILVTQSLDGGSLGVFLNRPTEVSLREAFPNYKNIAALTQPVYFGGHVFPQGKLFLVHTRTRPPASVPVTRDVYLVSDADWVDRALDVSGTPEGRHPRVQALRVFAGHTSWAPRQLRAEIERNGWYLLPAERATLFDKDPQSLWPELVRRSVLRSTEIKKDELNQIHRLFHPKGLLG